MPGHSVLLLCLLVFHALTFFRRGLDKVVELRLVLRIIGKTNLYRFFSILLSTFPSLFTHLDLDSFVKVLLLIFHYACINRNCYFLFHILIMKYSITLLALASGALANYGGYGNNGAWGGGYGGGYGG